MIDDKIKGQTIREFYKLYVNKFNSNEMDKFIKNTNYQCQSRKTYTLIISISLKLNS